MFEKGFPVPALEHQPDIKGLEWIWSAFWKLSTCRAYGMDLGPIPWTAIHQFCSTRNMSWDVADHFEYCIMVMDVEFLKKPDEPKAPAKPKVK